MDFNYDVGNTLRITTNSFQVGRNQFGRLTSCTVNSNPRLVVQVPGQIWHHAKHKSVAITNTPLRLRMNDT